ncbi:MAG TPA: phosphoglycerate kinase [Vicinamibacterales bacterium]|nr:phosphoglycerate kinase [Vicinamibacterales bacterium]
MPGAKRSITDLKLDGRRVLMRVDFNVPVRDGAITDDTRIRASLPTIQYALDHGAEVVLCSHLGRPKGKPNPELSLKPVAGRLSELLGRPVIFASDCVGEPARAAVAQAGPHGVVLLENLRFHPEEEKNDAGFAAQLASLADVYVDDAFGSAHRAHASTEGVVRHVKEAAAGLLMQAELRYLGGVLQDPERPLVAVLGGAKVSDKLEVIENLIPRVDALLVGGAMAYTFFEARGLPIGRSLFEEDLVPTARDIDGRARARTLRFELPVDHVVAPPAVLKGADAPAEVLAVDDPAIADRAGLDIGPKTVAVYRAVIAGARTVVWNGPMGVFEIEAFAKGTMAIAHAVASIEGTSIIGGGDSIAAVAKAGVSDRITHISTGGGASLEFLAGRELPGVAALP